MSRLQLNILIAAFEPEREEWLRRQLQSLGGGWTLTACDGLRLNAHETHARERDLIFLHWRSRELVAWEAALSPQGPRGRAPEGIVAEIEETGGTRLLRRTVIIGENISRNDLVFCADHGIKLIFPLPAKQSQWDDEFKEFNKKIQKFLIDELKGGANKEDQLTRSFQDNLRHWHKLSDEQKMNLCDELLTKLGDSAIYGELMAQKSIKDGDLKGAEAWLHRALSKNPSYVKAIQQLADIYGRQGKYDDALILLERLRSSDPRNMRRATQIGQIYMAKGEYLKAEKTLENAVCIDEFYRPAREELAKVKFMVGALDDAKRLLALVPHSRQYAVFLNQMGVKLVENKKFKEAISHYTNAQYVLPGNEQSHFLLFNIALAFAKWGHLAAARHFARLALVKEPDYQKAQLLLGKVGDGPLSAGVF